MRASFHTIGSGNAGVYDTLGRMRQLVRQQVALPIVRLTAAGIVRGTERDWLAQARALRQYVFNTTEFLRDPRGTELLQAPDYLLATIRTQGIVPVDCDDVAMLAAALGMSIGLRARFVTIGQRQLEHVFAELGAPDKRGWLNVDLTRPREGIPAALLKFVTIVEV